MKEKNSAQLQELKKIIEEVGHDNIWRPIITPDNQILSGGIGDSADGLTIDLHGLNFQGKTVLDLGCNFGFYSFLIKQAGAKSVLGVDIDERIVRGCNILCSIYNTEDVQFRAQDITTLNGEDSVDTSILIDFIGKNIIYTGMLPGILDTIERMSKKEMLISVRPVYRIGKHLQNHTGGIIDKYSKRYVRNGCFFALEYTTDRFSADWDIQIISPKDNPEGTVKETLHLTRKGSR